MLSILFHNMVLQIVVTIYENIQHFKNRQDEKLNEIQIFTQHSGLNLYGLKLREIPRTYTMIRV